MAARVPDMAGFLAAGNQRKQINNEAENAGMSALFTGMGQLGASIERNADRAERAGVRKQEQGNIDRARTDAMQQEAAKVAYDKGINPATHQRVLEGAPGALETAEAEMAIRRTTDVERNLSDLYRSIMVQGKAKMALNDIEAADIASKVEPFLPVVMPGKKPELYKAVSVLAGRAPNQFMQIIAAEAQLQGIDANRILLESQKSEADARDKAAQSVGFKDRFDMEAKLAAKKVGVESDELELRTANLRRALTFIKNNRTLLDDRERTELLAATANAELTLNEARANSNPLVVAKKLELGLGTGEANLLGSYMGAISNFVAMQAQVDDARTRALLTQRNNLLDSIEKKQQQLIASNADANVDGPTKDLMTEYIRKETQSLHEINSAITDNSRKVTDPVSMATMMLKNVGRLNQIYGESGLRPDMPEMDPIMQTFFKLSPTDQEKIRKAATELSYGLDNPLVNPPAKEEGEKKEEPQPNVADSMVDDLLPAGGR